MGKHTAPEGTALRTAQYGSQDLYLPDIVGGGYGTFWRSKARVIAVKGSRRSKKSKTTALKIIWLMLKYPLSNALVVRRYYNTLKDSCYTELKWAITRLGADGCFRCKESPLEITNIHTGQKIYFRGLDDPLKITSITCEKGSMCWLWVEESYELENVDDFDKLEESMMGGLPEGYFRQTILTFNPWSSSTWIKKRYFDTPAPDVLAMTTNYKCNEWLSEKDLEQFEYMRINQPERYRVSGLGEWGVDGAVFFEDFRRDVHVVTPFEIPEYWKMYRAIDYGLDALAGLYVAEDTEGTAYIVGEVYQHGLKVSDAAKALIDCEPRKQPYTTFAPPDLWARTKDTGRTIDELYEINGVPLTKADNNRFAGWLAVMERLKVIDDVDGLPTAHLKIFSTCKNLIRCLSTIKADEKNCNDAATEPHELTHLPDALRYFCISRTFVPKEPDARTDEQKMLSERKKQIFSKNKLKHKVYRI